MPNYGMSSSSGNPWGDAANTYQQGLNQLLQIRMKGQNDLAQAPLNLYDRFMDGYEKARARSLQEAELDRKNKLADLQITKFQSELSQYEEEKKQEREFNALLAGNTNDNGTVNLAGLRSSAGSKLDLSSLKKIQDLAAKNETIQKAEEAKDSAARIHVSQELGALRNAAQGPIAPDSVIKKLQELGATSPTHKKIADALLTRMGYGVASEESMAQNIPSIVDQQILSGMPLKEQFSTPHYAEFGGTYNQLNANPLGGPSKITPLGESAEKLAPEAKLLKAAGIDPSSPAGKAELLDMWQKKKTVQPTMGSIILQQQGPTNYDGSTPLRPVDENIAQQMVDNNFAVSDNMRADPAFKSQYMRAVQLAKEQGKPLPGTQNKVVMDTTKGALQDIEKKKALFDTYNNILGKNIDGLVAAANKIPDVGAKWLNRPIRSIASETSNPELAEFMPWYNAVTREYGKLSGFTNAGVLTDNAVKHAEEVLNKNGTLGEFLAATRAMHQEAKNTSSAWSSTRENLIKQVRGGGQSGSGTVNYRKKSTGVAYSFPVGSPQAQRAESDPDMMRQ